MTLAHAAPTFEEQVERLIRISNDKPLIPESFIPWDIKREEHHLFMPDSLLSLYGHPLFDQMSPQQKSDYAKAEIVQVLYSYAWSEEMACLFFFRHVSGMKDITTAECRYVLKEAEEECRHMQMFARAVKKLEVEPLPPRWLHLFIAQFSTRFLPSDVMFLSVLSIELVTDVYGTELRHQPNIYPVLAKISQLHNIEEGRHIHFTQLLLKRYTDNAGLIRRSFYSIVVCLNIYFMRTLYVRKEIFVKLGLDPKLYYRPAYKGLRDKFAESCLKRAVEFVEEWNGFNAFTRFVWNRVLGTKL